MKYEVIFSPGAKADLAEIEQYLANRFSQHNAEKYIRRIMTYCKSLALAPYRGSQRNDVRSGLRTAGFEKRVTILFEIQPSKVIILGVLYGGRTFEPSL
jgi:toxin ParE1/3/4